MDKALIKKAEEQLSHARTKILARYPFLSDQVYALVPIPFHLPPEANGMMVSKTGVMLYDPVKVGKEWTVDDVVTGLLHEAEHVYRRHLDRAEAALIAKAGPSGRQNWTISVECEINDDLAEMGCKLFNTDMVPSMYDLEPGKTAEQYYDELRNRPEPPGPGPGGFRCCGSCAGTPLDIEAEINVPGLDPTEREAVLEITREKTTAAIREYAQSHGNVPGGLLRYAELFTKPKKPIDWRKQLVYNARRMCMAVKGHMHTSYSSISRRQAGVGMGPGRPVIANNVGGKQANIALVIDTSGSMTEEEMSGPMAHARELLKQAGGQLTFASADAAVFAAGRIKRLSEAQRLIGGGGGTDFRPAFEYLKTLKPRPDVVVYGTDGYGTYPEPADVREFKIIWLMTTSYKAPLGVTINLPQS